MLAACSESKDTPEDSHVTDPGQKQGTEPGQQTVISPDTALEGKWISDTGAWFIDYANGTTTPYDTRKLHYAETLSKSGTETVAIFTYDEIAQPVTSKGYDGLRTHSIRFTKSGDCYDLLHSLDGDGVLGSYDVSKATKTDRICRPQSNPDLQKYAQDDTHYVQITKDRIVIQNGTDVFLDAQIADVDRQVKDGSASYTENLIVLVDGENVAEPYSTCQGKYTYLRINYYPEGSKNDPKSHIDVLYPKIFVTACYDSKEDAEGNAPSMNQKLGPYYES